MKKVLFSFLALATAIGWSCQNEDLRIDSKNTITLDATAVDQTESSRVGFDKAGKYFWSEYDCIGVQLSPDATEFTQMQITSGVGTASATFRCETSASATIGKYAVYPEHWMHKQNGNILTYHIDQYHGIANNSTESDFFTAEQGYGSSFNPPMYAEIEDRQAQFKHLGGVLCLKIGNLQPGYSVFRISSEQKLWGDFEVDLSQTNPIIKTSNESTSVEISFYNKYNLSQGIFHLPMPTGTFQNLKLQILNEEMQVLSSKNFGTVTIDRCMLKVLTNIKHVSSTTEANTAIEEGETLISISENNNAPGKAVEMLPNADNSAVELFFTGDRIQTEIKEKTGQTAPQPVNINMNGKQSGELIIDLPNSTVNLKSSATTTFDKATVRTADNTFEISKGINIKQLTVKGGSIILHKGSTVANITKEGDFDCYLYLEKGTTFDTTTLPTGITVVQEENCIRLTDTEPVITAMTAEAEIIFTPIVLPESYGGYGICYSSTNSTPTIDDNKTYAEYFKDLEGGKGGGPTYENITKTSHRLTGLSPKTTYYYRPYCTITDLYGKGEITVYGAETKTLTTEDVVLSTEEYVDLGLNILWRTRNLGATNIEDLGNDYYWGATEPSKAGDDVNIYADNLYDSKTRILKPEYDAAHLALGNGWRMPTNDELWELQHSCVFSDYELNSKPGCLVMGPNGNIIFLPKKHYNKEEIQGWNDPESPNKSEWYLSYWTSERSHNNGNQDQAFCLTDLWVKEDLGIAGTRYTSGLHGNVTWRRNALYNIRPVKDK